MMLAMRAADRAERVAAVAMRVARERADREDPSDWTTGESYGDFVAVLRSMQAWTEGPEWDPVVVVRSRLRPTEEFWGYLAAEVLDVASGLVDVEVGEADTVPVGRIEQGASPYEARLVMPCKANLDRVYAEDGMGFAPMVAVVLEGRAYFLNWGLQDVATVAAKLYPYRHGLCGPEYARNLLVLADGLGVDTVTAQRVADLVVPDRRGVDAELNTALRILSAEQELEIVASRLTYGGAPGPCGECGAAPGQPCREYGCQGQGR